MRGACTLIKMGQRPVRIGELQMFVACQCQVPEKTLVNKNAKNVAIVGSGPSGLGCAAQLHRLGYRVDIYERSNSIGGLMEKVIPAYRLPQEIVDGDIYRLLQSGISVRYETVIGKEEVGQLLDHYDAVFLGVGLSGEKILPIDGLFPQTQGGHSALAYLREARAYERGLTLSKPELGKKVVVVGGGNVALDAAMVAKRLGTEEVIVLYRRTKSEMPGWEREYLKSALLGVEFRWLSVVKNVRTENGVLRAVMVQKMALGTQQADGRRGVMVDLNTPAYELPCDSLLFALGQELEHDVVETFGLLVDDRGTIVVNSDFATVDPKVFAAGEAVSGGATIVFSMGQGMAAGKAIHSKLVGLES